MQVLLRKNNYQISEYQQQECKLQQQGIANQLLNFFILVFLLHKGVSHAVLYYVSKDIIVILQVSKGKVKGPFDIIIFRKF
jgi:hypothetical protein